MVSLMMSRCIIIQRLDVISALERYCTIFLRVPTAPEMSWNFFLIFQDLESLGKFFDFGKYWILKLKVLESLG